MKDFITPTSNGCRIQVHPPRIYEANVPVNSSEFTKFSCLCHDSNPIIEHIFHSWPHEDFKFLPTINYDSIDPLSHLTDSNHKFHLVRWYQYLFQCVRLAQL